MAPKSLIKKHLKPDLDFVVRRFRSEAPQLYIPLPREALVDWCMGLMLLEKRLVESLVVAQARGELTVDLCVQEPSARTLRTKVDFRTEQLRVELSPNDLGYALAFLLKYFRDGVAEVDHIDLQTVSDGSQGEGGYVTINVPDYAPPASPEEARRRLGMA